MPEMPKTAIIIANKKTCIENLPESGLYGEIHNNLFLGREIPRNITQM
jgi:hypothetical protein